MRIRLIALLILIAFPLKANSNRYQPITFYTHSSGSETVTINNQLNGIKHAGRRAYYIEFMHEVMKVMNVPTNIQNVPLPRGMNYVQNQSRVAFFNVSRIPEREDTVQWVAPLLQSRVFFYENTNFPTSIKSIADAKQVKVIGVIRDSVSEKSLKRDGFTNLYPVTSYPQARDMLLKGRVDLILYADYHSIDFEIDKSWKNITNTKVKAYESMGYLVFSNDISEATLSEWQQAIKQVKESKYHDTLLEQYLYSKSN